MDSPPIYPCLILCFCSLSTVVYLNVRIDREGMNRDVLVRDLQGGRGRDPVSDNDMQYNLVSGSEKV